MYKVSKMSDSFYTVFSYLNPLMRKWRSHHYITSMDSSTQFQVQIFYCTIIPDK
jgi:hypothetical protein